MASSPEVESNSNSDEAGEGRKPGEASEDPDCEEARYDQSNPSAEEGAGRNTDGDNYETTADIDLQLLEELGMSIQFREKKDERWHYEYD